MAERRPGLEDAGALFVGATRYRGPGSLLTLSRTWYPMIAKMKRMPGYRWHTVYWEFPFTLGTVAYFRSRDDLLAFARMPEHRRIMQWITDGTKNGRGGYIRLFLADGTQPTIDELFGMPRASAPDSTGPSA